MSGALPPNPARVWTRESLQALIRGHMQDTRFIVVSNREPYIHKSTREWVKPASGLASALDPIMHSSGGVWVAYGGGPADRETVDERDHVAVPPDQPAYTLRRVWLDPEIERNYYLGLSNEGLWPLCHIAFHRPEFSLVNWEAYREANRIFADAVLEEADGGTAFVFIQDYHFGLLPRMLKNRNPNLIVAHFWHIPWPNRETFRAFPWKEELLDGLLGNDLLGFHLRYHCANFLDTVDSGVEARVDPEHFEITRGGRTTMVRPFPISIDFDRQSEVAASPPATREMRHWLDRLPAAEITGIGIDRIDYTKGIPERLRAIDLFLERNREYAGRLIFVQVGVPSRTAIAGYRALDEEIQQLVTDINGRWGRDGWQPICFFRGDFSQLQLTALHRLADFCIVSSLHDGMNLVAKEFVGSRFDGDGVLILSSFTGAAREFTDALLVNPFAPDEMAGAILRGLTMSPDERRKRMQRMRAAVAENNIYRWAGKILSTLLKFEIPEQTPYEPHLAGVA